MSNWEPSSKRKKQGLCSPEKNAIATFHSLLDDKCDFQTIKDRLERDSSDINNLDGEGRTPLIVLLQNENCSPELIKLLLNKGADINCKDPHSNNYPLIMALRKFKNLEIIKFLVDNTPRHEKEGTQSPLCAAFQNFSRDVVNLLLEKGFASDRCRWHDSLLHCTLSTANSRLIDEDIFKALLQKQKDVINSLDSYNRTPFCIALMNGADPRHLDLLSQAGGSLFACGMHNNSPLLCATESKKVYCHSNEKRGKLRAHVISFLIKAGSQMDKVDEDGLMPVQRALRYCDYETAAIKMLLDQPGFDPNLLSKKNESLLYLALLNYNCKPDIVKLLIEREVPLDVRTTNW